MTAIRNDGGMNVITNSQNDVIRDNNKTTVNNNRTAPSTEVGDAKPVISAAGLDRRPLGDTSNSPSSDILKMIMSQIMKDGKITAGEAELFNQFAQLVKLLDDVQNQSTDPASESKDSVAAAAPRKGGGVESQAPPDYQQLTSGSPAAEEDDYAMQALGGNDDEVDAESGEEATGNPADSMNLMAPSAAQDVQRGGNGTSDSGSKAAFEPKSSRSSLSQANMGQALKNTVAMITKDGKIDNAELNLLSKMIERGAGKNLSEAGKTAMLSKAFDSLSKDGNFNNRDLATFNKIASMASSGGSVDGSGSRGSLRGSGKDVQQQRPSRGLPPPPTNAGTAEFVKGQLGKYMNPDQGNKKL
jgi:hypothetical protein